MLYSKQSVSKKKTSNSTIFPSRWVKLPVHSIFKALDWKSFPIEMTRQNSPYRDTQKGLFCRC